MRLLSATRYTTDPISIDFGTSSNTAVLIVSKGGNAIIPTYNGVSFNQLVSQVYYLANPALGTHNLLTSNGGGGVDARVYVFQGVDSSVINNAVFTTGSFNNNQSLSITPTVDNSILFCVVSSGQTGSITPLTGQANILNFGAGDSFSTGTQASPGKGNLGTVSYSLVSANSVTMAVVALQPFINQFNVSVANANNLTATVKQKNSFNVSQSVRVSRAQSRIIAWLGSGKFYALNFSVSVANKISRLASFMGRLKSGWTAQTKSTDIWTTQPKNKTKTITNFP